MSFRTRFWTLAVAIGALEMAGLSIGAPRVQALVESTGARAALTAGRQALNAATQSAARTATTALAPVLCQAIRGATSLLALVDRTTPDAVIVIHRGSYGCPLTEIRHATWAEFYHARRIRYLKAAEVL